MDLLSLDCFVTQTLELRCLVSQMSLWTLYCQITIFVILSYANKIVEPVTHANVDSSNL